MVEKIPISSEARATRPGNLAWLLVPRRRLVEIAIAVGAGLALSAAFAPLDWGWYGWFGLVPLLLLATRPGASPLLLGGIFGFFHLLTSHAWLREVFVLAPLGVTVLTFFYPALWLWLVMAIYRNLAIREKADLLPRARLADGVPRLPLLSPLRQVAFVLLASAAWCGLEWVRSWLFTGHPWNFLGATQWRNTWLLQLTSFTGLYGISFVMAAVNAGLFLAAWRWLQRGEEAPGRPWPWGLLAAIGCLLLSLLAIGRYPLPEPDTHIRVAAVQGNIPQIRVYEPGELTRTLQIYDSLSREIIRIEQPDLLIWPETAVPAPLLLDRESFEVLSKLMLDVRTPMILGSIDYRRNPEDPEDIRSFNSALYLDHEGNQVRLLGTYDKIHIVPFGEYVPFRYYLPWIVEYFSMGRDLTPGTDHTIFRFERARIGPNICYEDVFPEISRGAVLNGANLLLTLTNDAWYGETSGSRQHMINSIFRAVETRRPMMRSGNNADTLLIMPDGSLVDPLVDPITGSPFTRRAGIYRIPIWDEMPLTFYTRYGNLFAILCFAVLVGTTGWCAYRFVSRKRRLYEMVTAQPEPR